MLEENLTNLQQNQPHANPNFLQEIRSHVLELIERVTGSRQVILAHTLIVDFFEGDHNAAILLNQILYWSTRTENPDGWFYKTYAQWYSELRFSPYQVWRVVRGDDRVQKYKRTLWSLGLETDVKMAPNGRNAVFYRLNVEAFLTTFTEWLEQHFGSEIFRQPAKSRPVKQNPLKQYERIFGKLQSKTRKAIWGAQHILGEKRIIDLIQECAKTMTAWSAVIRKLQIEVMQYQTGSLTSEPEQPAVINVTKTSQPLVPVSDMVTAQVSETWDKAHTNIKIMMNESDYAFLLTDHVLVDYLSVDPNSVYGETYVLAVKNDHAQEMLQHRHYRFIRRVLSDSAKHEVDIRFFTFDQWRNQPRE